MKRALSSAYTFSPGSAQLNLSGIAAFTVAGLYAVLNLTTGALVYAAGTPGYGYSALSGTTLTLQAAMTGMAATDALMVLYEDPSAIATTGAAGPAAEGSSVTQALSGANLLSTVSASASRLGWWFCQNQSAATLLVVLDDGAGTGLSTFLLAPGGAGAQGGSMGSADTGPHLGRLRVYGPACSQHALRVQ